MKTHPRLGHALDGLDLLVVDDVVVDDDARIEVGLLLLERRYLEKVYVPVHVATAQLLLRAQRHLDLTAAEHLVALAFRHLAHVLDLLLRYGERLPWRRERERGV